MASCYAFAGDNSVYWPLWGALPTRGPAAQAAVLLAGTGPRTCRAPPHFYLEQLAQLVLDEDAHGHLFTSAPALYWILTGVDESTWRRESV